MAKITFIGAGSTVFAKNLLGDILSFPELATSTITLFDINQERLETSKVVAEKVAATVGAKPKIEITTDRKKALKNADYAINMIQVGGYEPSTVIDFEIPKKYGLRQTIADTLGIGGIMRALRTVPVLLEMQRDMEKLCPDVVHLNYVNPMAMNIMALRRSSPIMSIGLCHSVQGTAEQLASDIKVPVEEIDYICAGINHVAFYLKFERNGEDLYPKIAEVARRQNKDLPKRRMATWQLRDAVRYEMFRRLGYFVTESSEHFSEYSPWFIKKGHPKLVKDFEIPLDEYPRRCIKNIKGWEKLQKELEDPNATLEVRRSHEYGSLIIHSMETGQPRVVYSNVPNHNLIDNLPNTAVVEVPCLVDKSGLQPTKVGALPPHLAALMQTNINVQTLTVEALLTGKREHIYHAAMLDPHTAAELTLDQIWNLVDDLLEAHGEYIPAPLRKAA
ncbi:MAG: alpha-glucosidase/alpha-galactosidase [Trueperaceae bacterium]